MENRYCVKQARYRYRKQGLKFAFKNLGYILSQSYLHACTERRTPTHIILGAKDKVVSNHIAALDDVKHIQVDLIQADHLSPIGVPSSLAALIYQYL